MSTQLSVASNNGAQAFSTFKRNYPAGDSSDSYELALQGRSWVPPGIHENGENVFDFLIKHHAIKGVKTTLDLSRNLVNRNFGQPAL